MAVASLASLVTLLQTSNRTWKALLGGIAGVTNEAANQESKVAAVVYRPPRVSTGENLYTWR